MVDVNIVKNQEVFKLKICLTNNIDYDSIKHMLLRLDSVKYNEENKTFLFNVNNLSKVMDCLDGEMIGYHFYNYENVNFEERALFAKKENVYQEPTTPKKTYRKKEFVNGKFKTINKIVEIRQQKDGYYTIDMDWNAEVNTFLRSLDEDSRYFDSELKVWKMTSDHLTDLTNVIEREGLLYKINYF